MKTSHNWEHSYQGMSYGIRSFNKRCILLGPGKERECHSTCNWKLSEASATAREIRADLHMSKSALDGVCRLEGKRPGMRLLQ